MLKEVNMPEVPKRTFSIQLTKFQIHLENHQQTKGLNHESKNLNHKAKSIKIHFIKIGKIQMF